jgi:hypothetical protein
MGVGVPTVGVTFTVAVPVIKFEHSVPVLYLTLTRVYVNVPAVVVGAFIVAELVVTSIVV